MKNLTKILVLAIVLISIGFVGCKKETEIQDLQKQEDFNQIKKKATAFSQEHDNLLKQLLRVDSIKLVAKREKTKNKKAVLNMNEQLDLIQEVCGHRPIKITAKEMLSITQKDNVPIYNLDTRQIIFADYTKDKVLKKYFSLIDKLIQNKTINSNEKIKQINDIQQIVKKDNTIEQVDVERFLESTEVLKGSLVLWSEEDKTLTDFKGVNSWPLWKKLAFVASADAIGGVVGYFLGGIIVVDGQSLYVPPPAGVVMAVSLSYIAAKFVGW